MSGIALRAHVAYDLAEVVRTVSRARHLIAGAARGAECTREEGGGASCTPDVRCMCARLCCRRLLLPFMSFSSCHVWFSLGFRQSLWFYWAHS